MCDTHSVNDMLQSARTGAFSRRTFGALSLGLGASMVLPRVAGAAALSENNVEIKTADGTVDAYFVHPASGAVPAVIMWPDIMGLRPAFRTMAQRLAASGYAVLVPNPFYRIMKAPILDDITLFYKDDATRNRLLGMARALTADMLSADTRAFVTYLDQQKAVDKKRRMGTAGYCMGGAITLRIAAALPDRIGAGASFHGARLVVDTPDSPHLLIPRIKAHFLIAIAENDDEQDPAAKQVLRDAFAKANVPAEIEVYQGAKHGWCPLDTPVYNEAQAERAWERMLTLFNSALV